MTIQDLPTLNALLNAAAGIFLWIGRPAIKKHGNRKRHIKCMVTALVFSTLFLISYLTYHSLSGSTRYQGTGIFRIIYFFILITHIPLAVIVVPASLTAVRHAYKDRLEKHVRITRWLWPVWMYVSVTGVLIYLMLYILPIR